MINRGYLPLCVVLMCLAISSCATDKAAKIRQAYNPFHLESPRYGHGLATDGKNLYAFGGTNKNGLLGDIEIINPHTRNIQVLKRHFIPRAFFSAVYAGNNAVYLIGGISRSADELHYESQVEVFNTQTREVTQTAPLPFPTQVNTAVYLDGKIYVIGGSLHDWETRNMKRSSLMSVYDIASDSWSLAPPMLSEKETAAVVREGKIYVVGGYDGDKALNTFERFDPATNQWQSLAPLPLPVSAHSAVLWRDKLLTFGNHNDKPLTYLYDFKKNKWKQIKLDYIASRHQKAAVIDETVFVTGGNRGTDEPAPLNSIQIFNAKKLQKAF